MFTLILVGISVFLGFSTGDWFALASVVIIYVGAYIWGYYSGILNIRKNITYFVDRVILGFVAPIVLIAAMFVHYN